jgi:acyl-CoA reductase-like NAD-dependent aldehyde dehydrogenase
MHGIYVDGGWADARTNAAVEIKNPATLKTLDTVPVCGAEDVERAVAAAHAAQSAWCRTPALERAALLRDIAARVRAKQDELAVSLTLETGKPLCESRDCLDAVAAIFDRYGASTASGSSAAVVAVITPFNFPLLALASSAAPALAAGSTLVCKPPSQNPLTSLAFVRLCEMLPKGVINLVTGAADAATALVAHPLVTRISFTGSSEVACRLQALALGKQLDLETGSLDAFIVCEDADLERAVPGLAWARLMNAGQTCASGRHIYVERAIAAELAERIHQYVGFLDVDDPAKRPTDLGPLISRDAAQRVEDQVGRALRDGSKLILGGRRFRPSGLPGHFFQPTILSDVRPGSAPTREEILGPVITMAPVSDLGEALELSSRAASPLRAWIYTGDPAAAASRARVHAGGTFFINEPRNPAGGPFGGLRFGRIRTALGEEPVAVRSSAEPRVESAPTLAARSWWFPYLERYRT